MYASGSRDPGFLGSSQVIERRFEVMSLSDVCEPTPAIHTRMGPDLLGPSRRVACFDQCKKRFQVKRFLQAMANTHSKRLLHGIAI